MRGRRMICKPLLWAMSCLLVMTAGVIIKGFYEAYIHRAVVVHVKPLKSDQAVLAANARPSVQLAVNAVGDGQEVIRVLTYNIRHGKGQDGKVDLTRIADVLRGSGADLIGLQEIDRWNPRSGFQDQIRELGRTLQMHWSFSPTIRFGMVQYGNAVLSRFPIIDAQAYLLNGSMEDRNLLRTAISTPNGPLQVFVTHLGTKEAERERQMTAISRILSVDRGPAILLGDFNMESDHELMNYLPKEWFEPGFAYETAGATSIGGKQLDRIYVNHPVGQFRMETIPVTASDHFPVLAGWIWERNVVH